MYDKKILTSISSYFIKTNEHIAVAESVTSGHLQAALSAADHATEFFQGGITAYNALQKFRHLHIELDKTINCNSVSLTIAGDMALSVRKLFTAQWGIGITGYAAPIEEEGIVELYAYYAVSFKNKILRSDVIHAPKRNTTDIQIFYTNHLLKSLSLLLNQKEKEP